MISKLFYYLLKVISRVISSDKLQTKIDSLGYALSIQKYTRQGAQIGDRFYIGKDCTITGATLLGHDASPTLFLKELVVHKDSYRKGSRRSYRKAITIGDNVFIGWGSIILPGVTIGSNTIIGAGSVVTKDIPDGVVAAGNPAKVVKSTDDYVTAYRETLKKEPGNF